MLTTRSANGSFHSRAMTPASRTSLNSLCMRLLTSTLAYSETQLTLIFLANNASHKFEEIQNDANVNVSFLDHDTTAWAS